MAKILRHYRITKETDTLIKAEATRLGKSEADIVSMAMVRWCDSVAEMPGIEKLYKPAEEAKTLESPAQVPKAVKKASKKEKAIQERAVIIPFTQGGYCAKLPAWSDAPSILAQALQRTG